MNETKIILIENGQQKEINVQNEYMIFAKDSKTAELLQLPKTTNKEFLTTITRFCNKTREEIEAQDIRVRNYNKLIKLTTFVKDLTEEEKKTLKWLANQDKPIVDNMLSIFEKTRNPPQTLSNYIATVLGVITLFTFPWWILKLNEYLAGTIK